MNRDEQIVAQDFSKVVKEDSAAEFLHQVDIFSQLTVPEINSIIARLHFIDIDGGETLFREGDEGNELFIVKSGKVAITIKLPSGRERELREFESGDFFGEMSIFENAPRSATCYAKQKSQLFSFHKKDFFELLESSPSIAITIMYRMSNITTERLRNTSEFLSDMVLWGEKARKRAITDELTGVYNRHFLEDSLENLFRTAKSRKRPISLVMVDLDHFRAINEYYGHKTGDRIILAVVDVFKKHLRKRDIIARYGGDEFTVIMPQTGLKEAQGIAEKICTAVARMDILKDPDCPLGRVTTSQGIAAYPDHAKDLKTLREKADQALYKSKEGGRNRVCCAG